MITVLARFAGIDISGGSSWYSQAVEWGVEKGITDGLNLEDNLTREQLAALLYRYAGSPETQHKLNFSDAEDISDYTVSAMAWAVDNGIISGYPDGSVKPKNTAARAEVSAVLHRFSLTAA